MNNIFNEQLVKRESTSKDKAKKAGIVLGAIILIIVVNTFIPPQFIFIIVAAIIFGAVFLMNRLNKEHEYIMTDGDLDIDVIYNKSKRKRALSVKVKKFDIVVSANDKQYERETLNFEKVYDFGSGTINEKSYIAMFSHDGKRTKMIFEPNDKLLEAMKHFIPRKLKWNKYGQ